MKIIEQVSKIIEAYKKSYKTLSIDLLLNCKDKLVTLNFNLAEEVAEAKKSYNYGYYIRKINIIKAKNRYINQGTSATAAEAKALEEFAGDLKTELDREAISYRMDLLLRQSNKVVDALQQRISFLKIEKANAEYGQNT